MMRHYNRYWSRFYQPDPYDGAYDFTDPQSFNRYAYVQNDPVNFVDPSGLDGDDFFNDPENPEIISTDAWDRYWTWGGGPGGLHGPILEQGGGGGGDEGIVSHETQELSSCADFAEALANRLYNAIFKTPGASGENVAKLAKAMRTNAEANEDEFGNNFKEYSTYGFKKELIDNGQGNDVYRHIMWVASTYLDGSNARRMVFTNYDRQQKLRGRKESETELRDDQAGIEVGKLMSQAVKAGLSADFKGLADAIRGVLCNETK